MARTSDSRLPRRNNHLCDFVKDIYSSLNYGQKHNNFSHINIALAHKMHGGYPDISYELYVTAEKIFHNNKFNHPVCQYNERRKHTISEDGELDLDSEISFLKGRLNESLKAYNLQSEIVGDNIQVYGIQTPDEQNSHTVDITA